jgi:AraC family transcriptional activator of pobA
MNLDEFTKDKIGCYSVETGIAVWEVENSKYLHNIDIPEVHIQLFIARGNLDAMIDNQRVTLYNDSIIDILHSTLSIKSASDDIVAIFIFTTETFISNFMNNKPPFPIEYIMQMIEQPVLVLNHNQSVTIHQRLNLVLSLSKDNTHHYQSEMLKCALWMVYLEMSNIFMHLNDDSDDFSESDHKHALFMNFVKKLPLHVKEERSIGYYASELCVSCQYLERVVKTISGQTAYQWIQRTLIGEVNHQLKETNLSMQQIADHFGFPDQATFTKYYKRNTGKTPTEFRNKNIV